MLVALANPDALDAGGNQALVLAIEGSHGDIRKILLQHGDDSDARGEKDLSAPRTIINGRDEGIEERGRERSQPSRPMA